MDDPTDRERVEDEDLELDAEGAEDVKGGTDYLAKTSTTTYDPLNAKIDKTAPTTTTTTTTRTGTTVPPKLI